jgi:ATP-dependent Lon protease
MKINKDVKNYINYIKKNGDKKRKLCTSEILKHFFIISIDRLSKIDTTILEYKGDKLKLFINNLLNVFKISIISFKKNKQIKKTIALVLRLSTIAEYSVSIDILKKIKKFDKSYNEIINELKEKILNSSDDDSKDNDKEKDKDKENNGSSDSNDSSSDSNDSSSDSDDSSSDSDDSSSDSDDSSSDSDDSSSDRDDSSSENIIKYIFNNDNYNNIEDEIKLYYNNLTNEEKENQINNINDINNFHKNDKPLVFRILDLPLNLSSKNNILKCYLQLLNNSNNGSDNKLKLWFDSLMMIPFGKYTESLLENNPKEFFTKLENTMDDAIYGHDEAKRQIIQIIGQQLRNPKAKGNIIGLWGPMGCGKCFALNTPILMYDGKIKNVQDINIGDIIMGDDSTPRNVLSLGNGRDKMYEIISDNGDNYTVNSEHILCLKIPNSFHDNIKSENSSNEIKYFDNIIEITVNDYLKLSEFIKSKFKGYKKSVDFLKKEVSIEPYILGSQLSNYKYIPDEYKINDEDTRLKLLAGIIDAKGCLKKNNYEIIENSETLLDDIIFLCRSLGIGVVKGNNSIIIFGNKLVKIPLLCLKNYNYNYNNDTEFDVLENYINIVPKGVDNYYGFTIDNNNRFLLGDFTVTHNTSLIKEGIAKAMDKPFIFISLGGATDASFLEGHSYTYEGSIYGRIVNGLIDTQCMDPIIYFDELDKISKTPKGEEITNILIHLTDPIQNSHFRDKYFHGIEIDLSRATIIFSYNNPHNVNPILLDRITSIQTKYLLLSQKIYIAKNYLLPNILKDIGLNYDDINIDDNLIEYIINTYTCEGGVRKIKSLLYNIVRELNLKNLLDDIIFPYSIIKSDINILLKHKHEVSIEKIHNKNRVGIINGLYAMSDGSHGGIIPIQVFWTPSSKPLEIKATGNLQQVIKESTEVACTLAFNHLSVKNQYKILDKLSEYCKGLHIHCPSGGTPKDGPSAGTAITVAIYSILTNNKIRNDIAITGEITLEGRVTEIGGLDNKLEGAKMAGVKLVLFPKENLKDLKKIKEENPMLLDDNFKAIPIETINEAIKLSLI